MTEADFITLVLKVICIYFIYRYLRECLSNYRQPTPPDGPSRICSTFYNFKGIVDESEVVKIKQGIHELDLHMLKVLEAIRVTQMFLKQSRGRCCCVRIITGRGLHSPDGIPKIKPEVQKLLGNRGYKFKEINKGGGLEVYL